MNRPKFGSPEWEKLVEDIKGRHAERMNDILDELPDKQFRIVYPKLLEFVIPKMQRQEVIKHTNQNNVLQIQVINNASEIGQEIIDVDSEDDDEPLPDVFLDKE